jgi:glutamate dehydrogenase/leucine dehydrogenase
LNEEDAKHLIANGVCVTEQYAMYSRSDQVVLESESTFAPGKAANAGGVAARIRDDSKLYSIELD